MKKVLYLLISTFLFSGFILAQESNFDINQILQTTTMPSDSEIMQMVEMFAKTNEEKQFLFSETKKQLELMYGSKNASVLIDIYQNSTNSSNQKDADSVSTTVPNNVQKTPTKRTKKYTNHPPLMKDWRKK